MDNNQAILNDILAELKKMNEWFDIEKSRLLRRASVPTTFQELLREFQESLREE